MNDIRDSVDAIRDRMVAACRRAGRLPEEVRLVAVTKRVDAERIRLAMAAGLADFGENYVQEAQRKIEALPAGPTWHMIGHVQANKAKYIPRLFNYVHSVDRWELAADLDRYGKELFVLFEVNLSGEPQKHGATKEGLKRMLEQAPALTHIRPVGLMTVPPASVDPEEARHYFAQLRALLDEANAGFGMDMRELSMGMSADFEVAIEEGATMVRVGTAIFGSRQ